MYLITINTVMHVYYPLKVNTGHFDNKLACLDIIVFSWNFHYQGIRNHVVG